MALSVPCLTLLALPLYVARLPLTLAEHGGAAINLLLAHAMDGTPSIMPKTFFLPHTTIPYCATCLILTADYRAIIAATHLPFVPTRLFACHCSPAPAVPTTYRSTWYFLPYGFFHTLVTDDRPLW